TTSARSRPQVSQAARRQCSSILGAATVSREPIRDGTVTQWLTESTSVQRRRPRSLLSTEVVVHVADGRSRRPLLRRDGRRRLQVIVKIHVHGVGMAAFRGLEVGDVLLIDLLNAHCVSAIAVNGTESQNAPFQ